MLIDGSMPVSLCLALNARLARLSEESDAFVLRESWEECMASRVPRTPSIVLVNEVLDEHGPYARTLRVRVPSGQSGDALKAGANMVLERPVRADVLQAEIARLLRS
jgi:hypothetical protein